MDRLEQQMRFLALVLVEAALALTIKNCTQQHIAPGGHVAVAVRLAFPSMRRELTTTSSGERQQIIFRRKLAE